MSSEKQKSEVFIQEKYIQLLENANTDLHKKSKVFTLKNILVYSVIMLGIVSFSIYLTLPKHTTDVFAKHLSVSQYNPNLLLIKGQGDTYYQVPENKEIKWVANNNLFIQINHNEIHFTATGTTSSNEYYTLITPKNKQYNLFLTDGTKIRVNEKSNISFTNNRFSKKNNVILQGEAYFDVAHNKEHPFIIQASKMEISVLGTEFNVQNYKENAFAKVALINGSVNVATRHNNKIIVPGEQATIRKNSNQIEVSQANLDEVLSWTSNSFSFSNKELSNIVKVVGAWYHVKFHIENDFINRIHFTGIIKKQDGLLHFLQILKYTEGINFEISNDTIKLTKKKNKLIINIHN